MKPSPRAGSWPSCASIHRVFDPALHLAAAGHAAARGREAEAAGLAVQAASAAADGEQWAIEAGARHDAVRLGQARLSRRGSPSWRTASTVRWWPPMQEHAATAATAAAGDGACLDAAAASFEGMGAVLLAADAAAQAAFTHAQAGSRDDKHARRPAPQR